jgi:HPt (histidine-containing phosphotransfer) domain-containing protein
LGRINAFHRDIHSLCGSAAIYGFDALSKAARALENYSGNFEEMQTAKTSAIELDISNLLKDFDEAANSPGKINPSYQQFVAFRSEGTQPENTLYVVGY